MSRKQDSKQSRAEPLADEDATGEEEAQESQRRCQVCQDVPSSIICLTCSHTIDIPCAARVIIESAGENQPDITSVECQECGVVTDLSEEVQGAILAFISRGLEEEYGEEEQNGNEEAEENNYQEEVGDEEQDPEEEQEQVPATTSEPKSEYRTIHGSAAAHGASKHQHGDQHRDSYPTKQPSSSNGFGRGTPQTESNRPTPKRSTSELKESVSQTADLSLRFVCLEHPSDEYAYYSPLRRKLYCAQCILVNDIANKVKDLKPLKRCLPLILQHFSEMLNEVKVSRNLLSNRKRDLEIRLEDLAAKLEGIKNSEILRLEDLLERLEAGKQQFVENFDQKVRGLLTEVADHSDNLDEKLDFLENVELKIQELQQPDSEEDLIGFYFANQEVIRDFLQEQSEQKLMTRLRTNCESAELKAKAFCDTEMLKLHHSMTKDLADLFKDVSKGFSLKEDIIKFETEFVQSRGLGQQNFLSRTPKPIDHTSLSQNRVANQQQPLGGVRVSHNFERLSGSDSKVPYRNTWGRQGSDSGDREEVKGYDASRLSRPASGKVPARESPFRPQAGFSNQTPASGIDRRTQENAPISRERRPMTPTISSVNGRPQSQATGTPQPLLKALDNPFFEIEKKLAVFDIKNPSNQNRLIRGGPLQSSGPVFSGSLLRASPLLGLRAVRGGHLGDHRLFSGKVDPLTTANRIENIDSLRCFRQKVRDRFQTTQNSRNFVPLF